MFVAMMIKQMLDDVLWLITFEHVAVVASQHVTTKIPYMSMLCHKLYLPIFHYLIAYNSNLKAVNSHLYNRISSIFIQSMV